MCNILQVLRIYLTFMLYYIIIFKKGRVRNPATFSMNVNVPCHMALLNRGLTVLDALSQTEAELPQ